MELAQFSYPCMLTADNVYKDDEEPPGLEHHIITFSSSLITIVRYNLNKLQFQKTFPSVIISTYNRKSQNGYH